MNIVRTLLTRARGVSARTDLPVQNRSAIVSWNYWKTGGGLWPLSPNFCNVVSGLECANIDGGQMCNGKVLDNVIVVLWLSHTSPMIMTDMWFATCLPWFCFTQQVTLTQTNGGGGTLTWRNRRLPSPPRFIRSVSLSVHQSVSPSVCLVLFAYVELCHKLLIIFILFLQ